MAAFDKSGAAWFDYIKQNISSSREVSVTKEKYKIEKMNHLYTGVFCAKFNFRLEDFHKVLNIIGKNSINRQKCIIQLVGHPPRCSICEIIGHTGNKCHLYNLKCDNCKARGHLTENCSHAKRLNKMNEIPADLLNLEDHEHNNNNESPQNTVNTNQTEQDDDAIYMDDKDDSLISNTNQNSETDGLLPASTINDVFIDSILKTAADSHLKMNIQSSLENSKEIESQLETVKNEITKLTISVANLEDIFKSFKTKSTEKTNANNALKAERIKLKKATDRKKELIERLENAKSSIKKSLSRASNQNKPFTEAPSTSNSTKRKNAISPLSTINENKKPNNNNENN